MKLTMLGTGHAVVTKCYNTCFTLSENGEFFLVDAGGGNEILRILEDEQIPLSRIHNIFVSHAHTDHVLGVIWVIRMIGHLLRIEKYAGELKIFCHMELANTIEQICTLTMGKNFTQYLNNGIRFIPVVHGDTHSVLGHEIAFFDIGSAKMKQFGFVFCYDGRRTLVFCGDEPLRSGLFPIAKNCQWLLHEAFCLYAQRDCFQPYEKQHSTVKDACETAEKLCAKNLILYHTEDSDLANRKELYTHEGKAYYFGNIFVPNDREIIEL